MTPEAKAREILAIIKPPNAYSEIDVEHLAQALRDVEREALERAAKIADGYRTASIIAYTPVKLRAVRVIAGEIAQSIRSLLQKEGG